jgi:uncharacterized protein YpmS
MKTKKGMEMWQLVIIILAILLLIIVVIWYGELGDTLGKYLDQMLRFS